ncbi:MAG: 16S rRNA (cytosine(1402)-N(4))-methyltransferase, partial [Clostridia bacterium]
EMLTENSDEPYAEAIAKAIMRMFNKGEAIERTKQLSFAIEEALAFLPIKEREDTIKKSCQRTFQALRIDVNSEFQALSEFLEKLPNVLNKGGKVAILTFHSGEDRLVKKSFKTLAAQGIYSDVARDVIRPTAQECNQNPRAHSTKMRWAIKS